MGQIAAFNVDILVPVYNFPNPNKRSVRIAPNLVIAKGTLLGELNAQRGTYAPYNDANANGTEVARCLTEFAFTTDADGNVVFGQGAITQPFTQTHACFFSGAFRTTELVGLDAAAMADLHAHLESGTIADGIIIIPGG